MSDSRPAAETVSGAHAEMDYRHVEGDFGQTFATSVPCQLRFTAEVTADIERFHEALAARGFSPVGTDQDRRQTYDGEIASDDHFHRIHVLVFRQRVVRLYPLDDYVPTTDEVADVIAALEDGFDAPLEHDPIDRETNDD